MHDSDSALNFKVLEMFPFFSNLVVEIPAIKPAKGK